MVIIAMHNINNTIEIATLTAFNESFISSNSIRGLSPDLIHTTRTRTKDNENNLTDSNNTIMPDLIDVSSPIFS
jgi:hypothetical protein